MRPQHFAADNEGHRRSHARADRASMRPQHFAADNIQAEMIAEALSPLLQ